MILIAYGTRPEIIKLFPVIHALKRRKVRCTTLFTGQQRDLYEDVKNLVPEPSLSFADSFSGRGKNNTLGTSFIKICRAAEELFSKRSFSIVLVQGDTTTSWALAQMAFYNHIPVAHVEAGLRTFDLQNPFPEELNRTLISQAAAIHFAPTSEAAGNLEKAGMKNVHLTGNTIVDAVIYFRKRLKLSIKSSNKVLITLHRRENHAVMDRLFDELQGIALEYPDLKFVFPVHPNPNVRKHRKRLTAPNIHIVAPMGYREMLKLISGCRFIISDSGGLQEEATCFNKKIIIVRKKTERPETLDCGLGRLAGTEIRENVAWALERPPRLSRSPYGDGKASERIADLLAPYGCRR